MTVISRSAPTCLLFLLLVPGVLLADDVTLETGAVPPDRLGRVDFEITCIHDARGATAKRHGIDGLPNLFIIDVNGTIVHRHVGDGTLEVIVEEINALLVKNNLVGAG
jgi:hypothetical protein